MIVETIFNSGINFENQERVIYKALTDATTAENEEISELLIRRGVDVNYFDDSIKPPIIAAVYTGNINMTKMLLQHGADVECAHMLCFTPLFAANGKEDAEMINILLNYSESTYLHIY